MYDELTTCRKQYGYMDLPLIKKDDNISTVVIDDRTLVTSDAVDTKHSVPRDP